MAARALGTRVALRRKLPAVCLISAIFIIPEHYCRLFWHSTPVLERERWGPQQHTASRRVAYIDPAAGCQCTLRKSVVRPDRAAG